MQRAGIDHGGRRLLLRTARRGRHGSYAEAWYYGVEGGPLFRFSITAMGVKIPRTTSGQHVLPLLFDEQFPETSHCSPRPELGIHEDERGSFVF
ncbi:MAG: hypothetical protein R3B07_21750 [Polyangiaceae bacterium]